jgi:hypothetical protein
MSRHWPYFRVGKIPKVGGQVNSSIARDCRKH